jgi:hypothetical protein
MNQNPKAILAFIMPIVLGAATLAVMYLTPATVAKIGTIIGLAMTVLSGLAGVFVVPGSPAAVAAHRAAMLAESKKKTPTVPPVATACLMFGVLVFMACFTIASCAVQQALAPAEACIFNTALQQALAGNFTDPIAMMDLILATCAGVTAQDVINAIDDLAKQNDGGTLDPKLVALRAEAVKRKAAGK